MLQEMTRASPCPRNQTSRERQTDRKGDKAANLRRTPPHSARHRRASSLRRCDLRYPQRRSAGAVFAKNPQIDRLRKKALCACQHSALLDAIIGGSADKNYWHAIPFGGKPACTSRPFIPGICMSRIKHVVLRLTDDVKKSSADAKRAAAYPRALSRL